MINSRELNYNNKENPKDSKYLPTVRLNVFEPMVSEVQELPKNSTLGAQSDSLLKNRAMIIFSVMVSVVVLLYLANLFTSSQVDEGATSHISTVVPTEKHDAVIDSFSTNRSYPILSKEAINNGCIIITGTFSQQSNVHTMLNSIKSYGYTAYQSSDAAPIRVGLHFDCSDVNLDSMLLTVRQTLSNKAWYLVPRYEPEL